MSSSQMQTKRLRKKIVSADKSDMNELKPRMIDHLRVSKPCSTKLTTERESKKEAEFVEDGSVVMRSGTVQHSRMHPVCGLGFRDRLKREIVYPSEIVYSSLSDR